MKLQFIYDTQKINPTIPIREVDLSTQGELNEQFIRYFTIAKEKNKKIIECVVPDYVKSPVDKFKRAVEILSIYFQEKDLEDSKALYNNSDKEVKKILLVLTHLIGNMYLFDLYTRLFARNITTMTREELADAVGHKLEGSSKDVQKLINSYINK